MARWELTYAINDGSGMFGLEPAREQTIEVDLDTEGKDLTGADEQAVLEQMRAAVHQHAGEHAVLTDARPV